MFQVICSWWKMRTDMFPLLFGGQLDPRKRALQTEWERERVGQNTGAKGEKQHKTWPHSVCRLNSIFLLIYIYCIHLFLYSSVPSPLNPCPLLCLFVDVVDVGAIVVGVLQKSRPHSSLTLALGKTMAFINFSFCLPAHPLLMIVCSNCARVRFSGCARQINVT